MLDYRRRFSIFNKKIYKKMRTEKIIKTFIYRDIEQGSYRELSIYFFIICRIVLKFGQGIERILGYILKQKYKIRHYCRFFSVNR